MSTISEKKLSEAVATSGEAVATSGAQSPVTTEENYYLFQCPHCQLVIQVMKNEVACKIFRHGVYKSNNQQIPPHLPMNQCHELKEKDLIYGCGRPFRFVFADNDDKHFVEPCDYI